MTEFLEEALSCLRERPAADQDLAAEAIFQIIERDRPRYRLTPEQVEIVRQTQQGLRDGTIDLVPEEEMEEFWRRLTA